jgi:hypothetical protein
MILSFAPLQFPTARIIGLSAMMCASSSAQDVLDDLQMETLLPSRPAEEFFGAYPVESAVRLLDGMSATLGLSTMYDSAIGTQGDDMIFTVAPRIAYANPGTDWTLSANGGLSYSEYMNHSDLGGLGGNASVGLGYQGGRVAVASSLGISRELGSNRSYDSAYVERNYFNFGLSGSYQVSSKTSINAGLGYNWDDVDQGFGGSTGTTLSTSALWRYSPLLRFGPGLRYSVQSGDIQADRTTFGPTLSAYYRLTSKVSLSSVVGLDFVDYGGAGGISDEFLSVRLGADYRPRADWGVNLSVFRDARPDYTTAGAYREILSTRLGVSHDIRRARLAMGLTYQTDDRVSTNGGAIAGDDGSYLSYDASISMPLFRGRSAASAFFRWRQNDQGVIQDGSEYQIGVGLTTRF